MAIRISKQVGIGLLLSFILIGIAVVIEFRVQKKGDGENIKPVLNNQQSDVPTAPWVIMLAKEEIKASADLIEKNIIYAAKNKYRSTVYKRNLQNGMHTKIFEFDEHLEVNKSGNLWSGLSPNIALSPDKKNFAFIDDKGLKTYNVSTRNIKTFIRKTEEAPPESDDPPKWSVASLFNTYILGRPLWSTDNKYISFLEGHYEGGGIGAIDVESSTYLDLPIFGGYQNMTWSPLGHSYVKASGGGYEGNGLYVASKNNIKEPDNLTIPFGIAEDTPFFEADFSPDGKKIVFTFGEPENPTGEESYNITHLAIANIDGTDMKILTEKIDAQMPFFSHDGNAVIYSQLKNGRNVLIEYDLTNKTMKDLIMLPSEFNEWEKMGWTKDGFLMLIGVSSSSGLTLGGDTTRMLILDIKNKNVIYASPVFDQFTNFLGLSN